MKYIVAVSGGVDSVVLLDMLYRNTDASKDGLWKHDGQIVVAHFDHGIRKESADDAEFVRKLAEKYGLPFETRREELGPHASEELARERRYAFLREVAKKHDAIIMTAHHGDDMVESIAINLIRGTGWRGLAVLDSPDIVRPLLHMTKDEIKSYANEHQLVWREDATNRDTKYLRNDVRKKLQTLDAESHKLLRLYRDRQVYLRKEIERETSKLIGESPYSRYLLTHAPDAAALELLRAIFVRENGESPTRPQLARALHAVKVLHIGKRYEAAAGLTLHFNKTHFVVNTDEKMV